MKEKKRFMRYWIFFLTVGNKGLKKTEFLYRAARIKGVYVPRFYRVEYKEDGRVSRGDSN